MNPSNIVSRRFQLFAAVAAAFVFFLGGVSHVFAAERCSDITDGWKTENFSCDIFFGDTGGSGLQTCEYRVVGQSPASGYTQVPCSGDGPVFHEVGVSVGATGDCQLQGSGACSIETRVTDGSNNIDNESYFYNIDYTLPSGGSISHTDGFTSTTAVALTVNDGTDAHSGIDIATRTVQRKSAVLSGGVCGTYTSFANVSVTGTYPNFTNSGLSSETCYQYQYLVKDNAGNQAIYTSSNTLKVDVEFPRLNAFSADRTVLNIENPTIVIAFDPPTPEDFGGSGIQLVELWRKAPGGSWLQHGIPDTPPLGSSFSDTPTVEGTYEYGIHIVDNASNCITEGANNCATGASPGDGIERTAFSPLQVQVDKTAPATTITSEPDGLANSTSALFSFVSDEDGSTFECELDGAGFSSCTSPTSYEVLQGSHTFQVQAIDEAGNRDLTPASYSWVVDVTDPELDVFSQDRTLLTIDNSTTTFSWSAEDFGGAGLDLVELWRKAPGSSFIQLATDTSPSGSSASGSFQDNPAVDGTYEYGLHVLDTAGNLCDEGGGGGGGANACEGAYGGAGTLFVEVDKTRPPKPTCNPPGGTFPNRVNNVECFDAESGVTTMRYTLDDTAPTTSSTLYEGPFDITSSATLTVAAWDGVGNRSESPDNAYTFTILQNQAPTIQGSPSDSPDPVGIGAQITFTVTWTDPDAGDLTRLHICKTNSVSGQSCPGGAWEDSPSSFTGTSPSVQTYTILASDGGTNNYFAFVCDDENACSSSKSGSFSVDNIAPTINSFIRAAADAPPNWINNTTNPAVTLSWDVSDSGGSGLEQIEIWRTPDSGGAPDLNGWQEIVEARKTSGFDSPDSDADSYDDTSAGTGTFWYGLHVLDKAGNVTMEDTPHDVQSDKIDPVAIVSDPIPAEENWYRDDFVATFEDSDIGSGLASACEYQVTGLNSSGSDVFSEALARSCSLDAKTIGVGAGEVCQFEGVANCRVETRAFDIAGNISDWQIFDFSADFTEPVMGTPAPFTAQAQVSQTFASSLSDPVGRIASRSFFWKEGGSSLWNTGVVPTIDPLPCENGGECTVSVDHTFTEEGEYDIAFASADFAQAPLAPEGEQGGHVAWAFGSVTVGSLFHTVTADPSSGATTTAFDLVSQVSGSLTGLADFKYDCTNDGSWEVEVDDIDLDTSDPGWVERNGYDTKVTSPNTFAVRDLCQYEAEGTHVAKGQVQRDTGTAEDTVAIEVAANGAPEAANLSHNNDTANYCFVSSPPIILSWTFSDPDEGDSQSAYQVQVSANPGFGNPVIDTGKVASSNSQYSPPNLVYEATYNWRVRVWDSTDTPSDDWATGPSFTTPGHAYPRTDFSWTPVFAGPEDTIQFTDETVFAAGSANQSWFWDFGDGTTSTLQNPTHTYPDSGSYVVSLEATDDAGTCGGNNDIDGDGVPNSEDDDIDGDGIPNENDDIDGDGIPNDEDDDIDGDGIPNSEDDDIDGDGVSNGSDPTPNGGGGDDDNDGDGVPNGSDPTPNGGNGGSGQSIINVTLPLPQWQEISPF